MWHVGIDLHRQSVVIAAVNDVGEVRPARRFACATSSEIYAYFEGLKPFRAVVEATGTYRWLYQLLTPLGMVLLAQLLTPLGMVLLAHPLRLRALVQRRSKTDRLDAMLLADLLRINQIPLAHIPSEKCQMLRDITRHRSRMSRGQAESKAMLRWILARHNLSAPYKYPFGPRGRYWLSHQDFGTVDNQMRDELLDRLDHYNKQADLLDAQLQRLQTEFPEVECLLELHGIGLYSAMVIVAEFGNVLRFRTAKQAAAYTGLTTRVEQSGNHCYTGHITKQGPAWMRWVLVEAAMKIIHEDLPLANFYVRIRKRSSAKIARVATARKLAEICWKRLRRWHAEHPNSTSTAA